MFTRDEVEALRVYSGASYRLINAHLRGEEDCGLAISRCIRLLDRAIMKRALQEELRLYRGVDGDAAARMRASGIGIGDRFSDSAFTSASADPGTSKLFAAWPPGGLILRITLEANMFALDMSPFSEHPDEREFLLPRDLTFRVTGSDDSEPRMLDVEIC